MYPAATTSISPESADSALSVTRPEASVVRVPAGRMTRAPATGCSSLPDTTVNTVPAAHPGGGGGVGATTRELSPHAVVKAQRRAKCRRRVLMSGNAVAYHSGVQ